jgi:Holliday junction resolvase-like predicted endonuclease
MSTQQKKHDEGAKATLDVGKQLEQRREALAAAIKAAPEGRHQEEQASLKQTHQQFAASAAEADRKTVDAFFAGQKARLEKVQQLELEINKQALASADKLQQGSAAQQSEALQKLGSATKDAGQLHGQEQEQLRQEQEELARTLTVTDTEGRGKLLAALVRRQGEVWSKPEETARLAHGSGLDEKTQTFSKETMQAAERSADERVGSERLARGNKGEKLAADWLAANKYDILDYKPHIKGTNQGGIDMVAMKDDKVYLVDNKALSRDGNVSDVPALTDNFEKNLKKVKVSLRAMADDTERSADEIALIREAIAALDKGNYVKVVTNANIAENDRILSGVTDALKEKDIRFVDVMNKERDERNQAASAWLEENGYDLVHSRPEEELNLPGIDMVAMKDDVAYLLDNTAVTRSGELNEGSPLTRNFEKSLEDVKRSLRAEANSWSHATEDFVRVRAALSAIEDGRYVRAATNANTDRDDRRRQDDQAQRALQDAAKAQGLVLLDVLAAEQDAKKKAVTEEAEKEEEV